MQRGFLKFAVSVALVIAMVTAPGAALAQSRQTADAPRKSSRVKRAVWTLIGGAIGLGAGMTFGAIVFEDSLDSDRKAWTSAVAGAAIGAFIGNVSSRNVSSALPKRQPGHGAFGMKTFRYPGSLRPTSTPFMPDHILVPMRCDELRLTGSGGANRVMEGELKRLVMRSPFEVRVPNPKREGDATLLYPFDARIAWVAACHHRTSSRISWDIFSSPATRLEPLFEELLPALTADGRLPARSPLRVSVDLGSAHDFEASPLQLRGVVKNALVEALASRGVQAEVDADAPDVVFVTRRAGTPEHRRTVVGIDIGLGARHRRGARVAAGPAPLRETMAAQLVMLSRWDARSEVLVDPMAGGGTIPIEAAGLAVGAAIRRPPDLPFRHLPAFAGLPNEAPDLFPGTVAHILALDVDPERIPAMVGNLRAAGLTGAEYEDSIVIGQKDVRALTPDYVAGMLPGATHMRTGVFCFNPPYGVRIGGEAGEEKLLDLYAGMGRALARFRGWRAACFVANPRFVEAFGHVPIMTKPATNAELPGAFLTYQL